MGGSLEFRVVDEKGLPIKGAQLYVGADPLEGVFTDDQGVCVLSSISNSEEFKFTVIKDGLMSNELLIVVPESNESSLPVGKGSFTYNGKTYSIDSNMIMFSGLVV